VEHTHDRVEHGRFSHRAPGDGEDVADQHVLEVLGAFRSLAHRQDRRGRRDGVDDADDGLLRDARVRRVMRARQREDRRPRDREPQRPEVGHRIVQVVSGQVGHRGAERGDLREREVDEDDPPLHDVQAEVGVNAGQDQTGHERDHEKREDVHHFLSAATSVAMFLSKSWK
jgi:hypothetical protein